MEIKVGTKVRVNLSSRRGYHIGIFLGVDELGNYRIGVTETSIPGVSIKPGNKYISIFNTKAHRMKAV